MIIIIGIFVIAVFIMLLIMAVYALYTMIKLARSYADIDNKIDILNKKIKHILKVEVI